MIKHLNSRWHLLLLTLICSAGSVAAQGTVGAKVGVNMNQFTQPGTTIGLNAGVYGAYMVSPAVTVKLEPHYSQEGGGRPDYSRDYSQISDNIEAIHYINPSVLFHNLQVPLLIELSLPEFMEDAVKPKLILGGSYGFMMAATEMHTKRYDFIEDGGSTSPPPSGDPLADDPISLDAAYLRETVTDNYTRHQWSLWVGMGLEFKSGERSYGFDIRYRQGFNDLNLLRFASPGNSSGTVGVPGTGGELYSSSLSFNFNMSLFNF